MRGQRSWRTLTSGLRRLLAGIVILPVQATTETSTPPSAAKRARDSASRARGRGRRSLPSRTSNRRRKARS